NIGQPIPNFFRRQLRTGQFAQPVVGNKHRRWSVVGDQWSAKQLTTDYQPRTKLSKLLQESHVVFEQQTNIIKLINPRAGAIDAQAEREACKLSWIDIRRAQNVRMHHA